MQSPGFSLAQGASQGEGKWPGKMLRNARILELTPVILALIVFAAFFLLFAAQACANTVVFESTNAEQIFSVPAGVTDLHVIAIGGKGGGARIKNSSLAGGAGAKASADLVVSPGQALYVEVGGEGSYPVLENGGLGGFNGSANGGDGQNWLRRRRRRRHLERAHDMEGCRALLLNLRLIVAGGGRVSGGGEFSEGTGGTPVSRVISAQSKGRTAAARVPRARGAPVLPMAPAAPGAEMARYGIGGKGGFCEISGGSGGAACAAEAAEGQVRKVRTPAAGVVGAALTSAQMPANTSVAITSGPAWVDDRLFAFQHSSTPNPSGAATSPGTRLSSAKVDTTAKKATLKFTGNGQVTGFECALITKGSPRPELKRCRSPKTYRNLKPGKYTFEVRAVGPGGPDPTPAKKGFKVKNGQNS